MAGLPFSTLVTIIGPSPLPPDPLFCVRFKPRPLWSAQAVALPVPLTVKPASARTQNFKLARLKLKTVRNAVLLRDEPTELATTALYAPVQAVVRLEMVRVELVASVMATLFEYHW